MTATLGPRAASLALIVVMAVGSLVMWIGIPATWLWVASQIGGGSSTFSYLFALFLCPISMVLFAGLLHKLEVVYARISGSPASSGLARAAWLKSIRGEREAPRRRGILDVFMVISAAVAVIAFLVWWIAFSGPPPQIGVG
jgi:hypothetical protein